MQRPAIDCESSNPPNILSAFLDAKVKHACKFSCRTIQLTHKNRSPLYNDPRTCHEKDSSRVRRSVSQLHQGPSILVLPNAWDAASARVFEEAGFAAIGTSSAGVAFSLGYPDGQQISRDEMLSVVRRVARAANVPVTADVEAGYGSTPEAVAETARAVIDAGAVGMNLEDGAEDKPGFLVDLTKQKEIIAAVLKTAELAGVPFVLNARTDIFLYGIGPAETRLKRTIERLNVFREAGAQSLFAPGVNDSETIKATGTRRRGTAEYSGNRWHAACLRVAEIGCGARQRWFRAHARDPRIPGANGPRTPR